MARMFISLLLAVACIAGILGSIRLGDAAGGVGSAIGLGFAIISAFSAVTTLNHG